MALALRTSSSFGASSSAPTRLTPGTQVLGGRPGGGSISARAAVRARSTGGKSKPKCDVVLSSGFLAFANHSGFLQAVEESGIPIGGIMGTSAGAFTGSLYCAGYSPKEVAQVLSEVPPIKLLRWSRFPPWRGGLLTYEAVIDRLREVLPPTFEDLQCEFAVGVVDANGRHCIIDSGPLPEAVAASAAIPVVFEHVYIPGQDGNPFKDGGCVDRIGLTAWRDRRRQQLGLPARGSEEGKAAGGREPPPCLVHVMGKSSPFSGYDDAVGTGEKNILVVKSPKSGVNFFSLGDVEGAMAATMMRARPVMEQVKAA